MFAVTPTERGGYGVITCNFVVRQYSNNGA